MKTLQEEWEFYKAKCYPGGLTSEKEISVKQGFFAGTFCALDLVLHALQANNPKALANLFLESTAACDRLSDEAVARREADL
jgi:hypothetical protein